MSKATRGVFSDDRSTRLSRHLLAELPQIWSCLRSEDLPFVTLSVRCRYPEDFIAVLKRSSSDGGFEVLFGNGVSLETALVALEASYAAGRWRVDVPWKP